MEITIIEGYSRIEVVKKLFREYVASLEIDLDFQRFDEELRALPGKYARPQGRLYLALADGQEAGCIALRPLLPGDASSGILRDGKNKSASCDEEGAALIQSPLESKDHTEKQRALGFAAHPIESNSCEMKRLYVAPAYRKLHLGRLLGEKLIQEAKEQGYTAMYLDTLPTMTSAISLYRALGFREVEPYCYNPVEGTKYLKLDLR